MLALLEPLLRRLTAVTSDEDVRSILSDACLSFGFRSAYLIEYSHAGTLGAIKRVVDTDAARLSWWGTYFSSELRPSPQDVARMLEAGSILHLNGDRFDVGQNALRSVMETWDLVDVTAVPVSQNGALIGTVGFVGPADSGRARDMALILLSYAAFALPGAADPLSRPVTAPALTPREQEVMRLAAQGMTSDEIARQLGIAARTINQHVDNVASKLGTRNRAHTVGEIMRLRLI